jgi:hypothetical protein
MNKITLCTITGIGGFIGGIAVSKILVRLACEGLINEYHQNSVKRKNDFSEYLNKHKFNNQ